MDSNKLVVIEGLKRNNKEYGKPFCPCVPQYLYSTENANDFVCPCKEYREVGLCHCGLYENIRRDNL